MTPLYIFDLDGTLALIEHRRPLVTLMTGSPVTVNGEQATFHAYIKGEDRHYFIDYIQRGIWSRLKDEVKFTPNWQAFYAACSADLPNLPVTATLHFLRKFADIWVWSGRSDEVRDETVMWLKKNGIRHDALKMRQAGDFTPDEVLKQKWLGEMSLEDRQRLVAVFDDRAKVVQMWRNAGVACFQVAP